MEVTVNKKQRILLYLLFGAVLFSFFYVLSSKTPLAGDDWDYANEALQFGVLGKTLDLYLTWSGRFVSDAWTLFMSLHKGIWNVVNAVFYVGIFFMARYLVPDTKKPLLLMVVFLALMLGVNRDIRIEVYFWINGAHFTLPLFFLFAYLCLGKAYFLENHRSWKTVVSFSIVALLGGLCSENATVVMVVATFLLEVYVWITKTTRNKKDWLLLIPILVSTALMFSSPGMQQRANTENALWSSYNILEKIGLNWPSLLAYTFTRNVVLIIGLAGFLLLGNWTLKKRNTRYRKANALLIGINGVALVAILAQGLYQKGYFLNLSGILDVTESSLALGVYSLVFVLFVASTVMEIMLLFEKEKKAEPLFFLILAVCANAAMLMSPSFQARSSIYTVYLLGLVILCLAREVELPQPLTIVGILTCLVFSSYVGYTWFRYYQAVDEVQTLRLEQITYYQTHWNDTEIYMPRFPAYYMHGGDIEEEDAFHRAAFLKYYGMNPEANLYFYKLPQYMDQ